MKAAGLAAFFWFDNNWHYIRQWDHFKQNASLHAFPPGLKQAMEQYKTKQFPASDAIIGRCISTPVNLGWSQDEVKEKAEKLVKAVKSVL